ncbi:flagellin [Clostridium beijerinckii]|uniref:flagellin N-terminal helical domain-containing protein n=1 Tax=Clostridium beijerinckii TaxID=1520 RepID=UPI0022E91277|nr:flagellin [Clostridium beijerinckii]
MIINHNMNAITAYNKANEVGKTKSNAMKKLSSGLRINEASDDVAGSAISQKMKSQIRGLEQAARNIQDGVSLIQTADSGLANIMDPNLIRLRQLAVQAANGTLTSNDIQTIQQEVNQIINGIDSIANNTEFNGIKLLNGSDPNMSSTGNNLEVPFDYKNVLRLPTPNGTGQLSLFTNEGYPTTIEDNGKRLVFGTGSTSYPSIIVDGKNYYFQNQISSNPPGTSVNVMSDSIINDKYVTKYKLINTNNNVDLEVTQTIGIVADKYEIRYDVKNNSATSSQVGVEFNLDTDVADDDSAKFIVDGEDVLNEKLYSASSEVPDSFKVYNQYGTTNKIQASGILKTQENPYNSSIKYEILEEPSKFGIGKWHQGIENNDWVPSNNSTYGDSAYSIWYEEKALDAGETRSVNTFYGLSVPPTISIPDPVVIENPADIILQVGANNGNEFRVELSDVRTKKLFQDGYSLNTQDDANKLIKYVDVAIKKVSDERTKYGVYQNALEHIGNNVDNYGYNITSAESRISDTNMAKEVMEMSKSSIIEQSAQSILNQAEKMTQSIIDLMSKWQG